MFPQETDDCHGFVGMILAAGMGSRLAPFTQRVPKPLFPMFDVTLLELSARMLMEAGIRTIVVNAFHLAKQIEEAVATLSQRWPTVQFVVSREEVLMGTGGGIARARRHFAGADVLVVNADLIADWNVAEVCRQHRASGADVTLAVESGRQCPELRTTRVERDGLVVEVGCEEHRNEAWGIFAGMYALSPSAYQRLPEAPNSIVQSLIRPLILQKRVRALQREFAWCDLGTWQRVSHFVQDVLSDSPRWTWFRGLCPGVFSPDAKGRGTMYLGPDAHVEGPVHGPSMVGAGARVGPRAEVTRSILLPGVELEGPAIREVVGPDWRCALP